MNPIKMLECARNISDLIEENMTELKRLHERKESLPSSTIGSAGSSNENDAAYIRAYEKIENLEKKIFENNAELADHLSTLERIINKIDRWDYRLILKKKYISNKSLNAIAEEINCCEKTIQRKHKKALAAFEKAYNAMPKKFL
ncbi:MAG: DUF1492 domain-containing protein [Clostridia bacterium]|nr:DUF1492 domain-containing protein [Clostridia bacterium]